MNPKVIYTLRILESAGLSSKDVADLLRILEKVSTRDGLVHDFDDEQHIEIQEETAQYPEEALVLLASHVFRGNDLTQLREFANA